MLELWMIEDIVGVPVAEMSKVRTEVGKQSSNSLEEYEYLNSLEKALSSKVLCDVITLIFKNSFMTSESNLQLNMLWRMAFERRRSI